MSTYTLVIVESPAKAKTIEKYLGPNYKVLSSIGHVRDLPKSNTDAVDVENGFVPRYIISPGKEKVIDGLKSAAKKADIVLLASDPDREGEAIAWHVAELIKGSNSKLKRVAFNEITETAVKEAIAHPRAIDLNLKEAQEARRVLDRLVGYDLSGLIWKKVRYGLSAGRVQSPALRIVMEREREIRAFTSQTYFTLIAHTKAKGMRIPFLCIEEPTSEIEAKRIKQVGENNSWKVTGLKANEAKRSPRPPFTTSTLQQVASTRLGFSPSRTMSAAQKLYEAGLITYMRTDSTNISDTAQKQIIAFLQKNFGESYISPRKYKTKSKSAQEAHEAIRPSNFTKQNAGVSADQKALYNLIWKRTVSSQMSDATIKRSKLVINIDNNKENIPDFAVNGSQVVFPGWLTVDTNARGEDTEIPKLAVGDTLDLENIAIEQKATQPPNRYAEAGLIKELEKRGIGRPSTYASTMKTITDRGYVLKEGRSLIPTATGDVVSTFLEKHFPKYISDTFTSEMEEELDEIAEGKRTYVKTLTDFYLPFQKDVLAKENVEKLTNLGAGPVQFPCPLCGSTMIIKLGKSGTFLSCDRFPDCKGSRLIDGNEPKSDTPIGTDPESGLAIFIINGKFGPYVQLGEIPEKIKGKKAVTPKRASLPAGVKFEEVTLKDALKYLTLPRELGLHPTTGEPIIANTGKYGPYLAHAGDFRSLKGNDEPYTVEYKRALEIYKEPKGTRKGEKLLKELGINPVTKKMINVFESKSGRYLKKGFKRVSIPDEVATDDITIEVAIILLKQS